MAESAKNFKFISPGIKILEIDRSQIPARPEAVGPLIIGRARRGPAFKPVKISSFSEFVEIFGEPVAGGENNDVWRDGNFTSPMYGPYAVQAWLKNGEVCSYMRVLGDADSKATTDAGKAGWKTGAIDGQGNTGGAYGLFVFPSSSAGQAAALSGSLAAVWYMSEGAPILSGSLYGTASAGTQNKVGAGTSHFIVSDTNGNFTMQFSGSSDLPYNPEIEDTKLKFSLNKDKGNFIRKVFNTDPTLLNRKDSDSGLVKYFLGETFENTYNDANYFTASTGQETGTQVGVVLGLANALNALNHSVNQRRALQSNSLPKTGWFFTQHLSTDASSFNSTTGSFFADGTAKKLFRFVGLDTGEWIQNNLKIAVTNIQFSKNEDVDPYGTFDVVVRKLEDTDDNQKIVEKFTQCNLNRNSENFILNKIGDKYTDWDSVRKRTIEYGSYQNRSKYVRVEVNPEYEAGFDPTHVPFGFTGPTKYKDVYVRNNGEFDARSFQDSENANAGRRMVELGTDIAASNAVTVITGASYIPPLRIVFPEAPIRSTTSTLSTPKIAHWGVQPTPDGTNTFKEDVRDLLRAKPNGISNHDPDNYTKYQWIVSLDNLAYAGADNILDLDYESGSKGLGTIVYSTASRNIGFSITATGTLPSDFPDRSNVQASYKAPLVLGLGNLISPFYGGTDGFDIKDSDPLSNQGFNSSPTLLNDQQYFTLRRAIDAVKNPEVAEYNIVAIPGLTNVSLNKSLITNTEERADALAIIDVDKGYIPPHEYLYDSSLALSMGDVSDAQLDHRDNKYNSSYGAAYYPWVQVRDSVSNKNIWMPPSIAAIGAMAYTDRVQAPWFAPAGFNRGGLSSGVAGLPVNNVALKLFADDRDDLYAVNLNPIASFPNEGVVIFGQKTLAAQASALDRINVRRLLIFLKRGITRIANTVLFDQNVQDTWNRFTSQAEPFLADVKARFGLTDYRLILDESTTTPDLIDQNIMYAKVFLKPARAIEFIAIDFFITNTGASFSD